MTGLRARFGAALQQQRQRRGLTQVALAKAAGLSSKYVGEVERGESNVSLDVQERLCLALDWHPFELWVGEQSTLPDGVRAALVAVLLNIACLADGAGRTLASMQPEEGRRQAEAKPPRGRPRGKNRNPQPAMPAEMPLRCAD